MPTFCFECVVPQDDYERMLALWYSMDMQGCEELPASDGVKVKVYFRSEERTREASIGFLNIYPDKAFSCYEVEKQDWNAKWRESMQPAKLAPGYWVSPLWLPPNLDKGDIWIKIEPKMAFGTGHHETTRLAAAALIDNQHLIKNKVMVDVGTGSGVLCFVGDTLGARQCIGIEIDKDCQENLSENYQLNKPSGRIDFIIGTTDLLKKTFTYDCIVMNMILTESAPLLSHASRFLHPGGLMILSGILVNEFQKAVDLAAAVSCTPVRESRENEWWCGVFVKI
jgi:ribosomal protein L11 methyltransferase